MRALYVCGTSAEQRLANFDTNFTQRVTIRIFEKPRASRQTAQILTVACYYRREVRLCSLRRYSICLSVCAINQKVVDDFLKHGRKWRRMGTKAPLKYDLVALYKSVYYYYYIIITIISLQCLEAVGWAAGRASGL